LIVITLTIVFAAVLIMAMLAYEYFKDGRLFKCLLYILVAAFGLETAFMLIADYIIGRLS